MRGEARRRRPGHKVRLAALDGSRPCRYRRRVAVLPESARELLESNALAHMVTLNRDGSLQVTIVWVGLDGDEIVSAHLNRHQKVKNVERDPRVSISLEGTEANAMGLHYLVVHGRARVDEGGAPSSCSGSPRPTSAPA